MNRPIIIGILLFFIAFGILFYFIKHRPPENATTGTLPSSQANPAAPSARTIKVKLFFGTPGSAQLVGEERSIPYHDTLNLQAKEVLVALMAGPQGQLVPSIPNGVRLLDVMVSKDGVAYVDFSGEIVSNHQGGSAGEMVTVYSIVNTLSSNLPQIHGVQILVDDRAVDTLNGHLDLSRPLKPDLSLARQEKEPAQQSQPSAL